MNLQPQNISQEISKVIDEIQQQLQTNANVNTLTQATSEQLTVFQKEFHDAFEAFLKNSESTIFTIAFFGETNAGKSTLIEALRIAFGEETKQNEKSRCQILLGSLQEDLKQIRESLPTDLQTEDITCESIKNAIEMHIKQLSALDLEKIEKNLFFKIFYRIFSMLHLTSAQKKISSHQKTLHRIREGIQKIEPYRDGNIIGDGSPDYTKSLTIYTFKHEKKDFQIIDIPGIEGNESSVIEQISLAVQKAHAVFYITKDIKPPEKGDEKTKGTLEKIQKYLGDQTEVYSLYNKPIVTPRSLPKANLVSENESKGLEDLERQMKERLPERVYRGHKNISAYIAFLALSDCLASISLDGTSSLYTSRNKFLKAYSREDLLDLSGFDAFKDFLVKDFVHNTTKKIQDSHLNKINKILREKLITTLDKLSKDFEKMTDEQTAELKKTESKFQGALQQVKNDFDNVVTKNVDDFYAKVLEKIEDYIDLDVSNDDVQSELEDLIEEEQKRLIKILPPELDRIKRGFEEAINNRVNEFATRAMSIERAWIAEVSIQSMGSTVNGWGIAGSAVGAGALAYSVIFATTTLTPIGWITLAAGAISVIISVVKTVIGFLSSDYKKKHQSQEARKSLKANRNNMYANIMDNVGSMTSQFDDAIKQITEGLEKDINKTKSFNHNLGQSIQRIKIISDTIQKEIS